jgi:hypothetical protein
MPTFGGGCRLLLRGTSKGLEFDLPAAAASFANSCSQPRRDRMQEAGEQVPRSE